MAVARHLAAGAERGIENRHGHRITIRTADDVAHHGARRGDDGRFGRYLEIASLVERQQVLLLVDRVGHDAGGRVAVGTRQGRSHRVEGGEERLLAIERQFVFERRDPFEQASVFVGQGEEAFHAAGAPADEDSRFRQGPQPPPANGNCSGGRRGPLISSGTRSGRCFSVRCPFRARWHAADLRRYGTAVPSSP